MALDFADLIPADNAAPETEAAPTAAAPAPAPAVKSPLSFDDLTFDDMIPASTQSWPAAVGNAAVQGAIGGTGAAIAGIGGIGSALENNAATRVLAAADAVAAGEMTPQAAMKGLTPTQQNLFAEWVRGTPQERVEWRAEMGKMLTAAPNAMTTTGEHVGQYGETYKVDPSKEGWTTGGVRMAAGIVPAAAGAVAAGLVGGPTAGGMVMASTIFGQSYDMALREARAKGLPPEQADQAAIQNAAAQTAIMGVPMARLLSAVPAPMRDGVAKTLFNLGKHGVEFGSANALSRFVQNYILRESGKPDQPLTEGVMDAAAEGTIAGLIVPGGGAVVRGVARRAADALAPNASPGFRRAMADIEALAPEAQARPGEPPAIVEPGEAPQPPPRGMPTTATNDLLRAQIPEAEAPAPAAEPGRPSSEPAPASTEAAVPSTEGGEASTAAPAPATPLKLRTLQQIMDQDGVGAKKAQEVQSAEIEALGRPVTAEEVAARKAGIDAKPPAAIPTMMVRPEPEQAEGTLPTPEPRAPTLDDAMPEAHPGEDVGLAPAPDAPMVEPTGDAMANAVAPEAGRPPAKPLDAVSFLILHGGVKDTGGDLTAMGGDAYHHRQAGRLINNSRGMELDKARELLADHGYMSHDTDINDLQGLIYDHLAGRPKFPDHYEAERQQWEQGRAAQREHDRTTETLGDVVATAEQMGIRLSAAEQEHAARLILSGEPPEHAIEEAVRVGDRETIEAYNQLRGMLSAREKALADRAGADAPSPEAAETRRRLATVMQAVMRYAGLPSSVGLRLVDRLVDAQGNAADAAYYRGLITFALDTASVRGPGAVPAKLFHEVVHGLMDPALGILTPKQRTALLTAADRWLAHGDNRASLERMGYDPQQMREEAVARYAEEMLARSRDPGSIAQRAAETMARAAQAIGNGLRGQGFRSADGVLRAIMQGKVGAEESGAARVSPPSPGAQQESRRPPQPPATGPDLFGVEPPGKRERKEPEPTIKTDPRQQSMFGGPSAVQAQAARDQAGRGALTGKGQQRQADEGLFAPKAPDQDRLFSKREEGAPRTPEQAMARLARLPVIAKAATAVAEHASDLGSVVRMAVAPMAEGSKETMAQAKDFANLIRLARHETATLTKWLTDAFTPEERRQMWLAADEQSVLMQQGLPTDGVGLDRLSPDQRAAVERLQALSDDAFQQAQRLGMIESDGLPSYVPRMVVEMVDGVAKPIGAKKARNLPGSMENMQTNSPHLRHREHLTTEETERAARAALDNPNVEVVRDISTLPVATMKLQQAIAGRTLLNAIRKAGRQAGEQTVAEGAAPDDGFKWFTIAENPAFWTWRVKAGENGTRIMEKVPLFVRADYEGPLRAVLTRRTGGENEAGRIYDGLMGVKGRIMTGIMWGLVHSTVIAGRIFPKAPNLVRLYREGAVARNDPEAMRRFIQAGGVPIGHDFGYQDISGAINGDVPSNRYLSTVAARWVAGKISPELGNKVGNAVEAANDFVHNTLTWDTIGKWQMGMFNQIERGEIARGVDPQTASRIAAHVANRLAGAMPAEAMSAFAQKAANLLMFSRSYRIGGAGQIKDLINGLPRDVRAQIERDQGAEAALNAQQRGKRLARAVLIADLGIYALSNSLFQSAANVLLNGATVDDEAKGYLRRAMEQGSELLHKPWNALNPFWILDIPEKLMSTAENEPGKRTRILVGRQEDGTGVYLRNPAGKYPEDIFDYIQRPVQTLNRITSPFVKLGLGIFGNNRGFGRPIYDPYNGLDRSFLSNAWDVAKYIGEGVTPYSSFIEPVVSLARRAAGQPVGGSAAMDAAKLLGSAVGVTVSKGFPGGPEKGEIFAASKASDYEKAKAMPAIRDALRAGNEEEARQMMRDLHMTKQDQDRTVRSTLNPSRITAGQTRRLNQIAPPEIVERVDRARDRARP